MMDKMSEFSTDADSVNSEQSTATTNTTGTSAGYKNCSRMLIYSHLLNPTDPLLNNRLETLVSKCFPIDKNNAFGESLLKLKHSGNCFDDIFLKLELLKYKFKQNKSEDGWPKIFFSKVEGVELVDEDFKLSVGEQDLVQNASEQFERTFGTSIESVNKQKPCLELDSPAEQSRKLHQYIYEHNEKDLQMKSVIQDDIEQQIQLKPFRQSRRQRKKISALQRKSKLTQWFDMPRVEEISKDMEKDLQALKMRRVWNPKQFYKKSSQISAGDDLGLDNQSKYFQIGTIQSGHADYYSGRLTRKKRKQSIVDELMHDAQLKAYNKRKINYALTRNSRLMIMMKRAKLRRQKRKIRQRNESKANKFNSATQSRKISRTPHARANVFKTFEL